MHVASTETDPASTKVFSVVPKVLSAVPKVSPQYQKSSLFRSVVAIFFRSTKSGSHCEPRTPKHPVRAGSVRFGSNRANRKKRFYPVRFAEPNRTARTPFPGSNPGDYAISRSAEPAGTGRAVLTENRWPPFDGCSRKTFDLGFGFY
jgi:hypothetical protein